MLLCVTVTGRNRHTSAVSRAKLSLIDLAGSERVGKTDASGERLKEAQVLPPCMQPLHITYTYFI
jgi:Kinesin motor domain